MLNSSHPTSVVRRTAVVASLDQFRVGRSRGFDQVFYSELFASRGKGSAADPGECQLVEMKLCQALLVHIDRILHEEEASDKSLDARAVDNRSRGHLL